MPLYEFFCDKCKKEVSLTLSISEREKAFDFVKILDFGVAKVRDPDTSEGRVTQQGVVSVPNPSGHIYLVTNVHGQYRLIIVTRPTISGEMFGILTTLQVGRGAQLTPVAAPIALIPLRGLKEVQFGRVGPNDPCYAMYQRHLKRTIEEPFALFLPG